jgi:hypothetical protein
MSTSFGSVKGRKECPDELRRWDSYYVPQELHITRFAGSVENGTMLQLTLGNEHIQLNSDQVRDLMTILISTRV